MGIYLFRCSCIKSLKNNIKLTLICSAEKYAKLDSLIDISQLTDWIDYTKDEAFPDLQADVLLDLVGDNAGVQALNTLKSGARVCVLPTIWVDKLKEAGSDENLSVGGYAVKPNAEDMARVLQQVADGKLTLKISQSYPLSDVITAHHELEKGDTFGKLVLKVS